MKLSPRTIIFAMLLVAVLLSAYALSITVPQPPVLGFFDRYDITGSVAGEDNYLASLTATQDVAYTQNLDINCGPYGDQPRFIYVDMLKIEGNDGHLAKDESLSINLSVLDDVPGGWCAGKVIFNLSTKDSRQTLEIPVYVTVIVKPVDLSGGATYSRSVDLSGTNIQASIFDFDKSGNHIFDDMIQDLDLDQDIPAYTVTKDGYKDVLTLKFENFTMIFECWKETENGSVSGYNLCETNMPLSLVKNGVYVFESSTSGKNHTLFVFYHDKLTDKFLIVLKDK